MKPAWWILLWGALLLAYMLEAVKIGPPEDTFYYGTFPRGMSVCPSAHLSVTCKANALRLAISPVPKDVPNVFFFLFQLFI